MPYDTPNAYELNRQGAGEYACETSNLNLLDDAYGAKYFSAKAEINNDANARTSGDTMFSFAPANNLLFDLAGDKPRSQSESSESCADVSMDSASMDNMDDTEKPADKPADLVKNQKEKNDVPAGRFNSVDGADPKLLAFSDADLSKMIAEQSGKPEKFENVKSMFEELVRRYDSDLTKDQFSSSVSSTKTLLDALKAGKDLVDGPGDKRVLGTEKLSEDRRFSFHSAISSDMEKLNDQIRIRQEFAKFLQGAGKEKDAEKIGIQSRDLAERLMKPIDVDGKQVRPIDLIRDEATQLINDQSEMSSANKRLKLNDAYNSLAGVNLDSGLIKTPINTNKFLAELYLGAQELPKQNAQIPGGKAEVQYGSSSVFKPEEAFKAVEKSLLYTKEILKIDPLDTRVAAQNDGISSIYRGLVAIVEKPENYGLKVAQKGDSFIDDKGKTMNLQGNEIVGKNKSDAPILMTSNMIKELKDRTAKKENSISDLLLDWPYPLPPKK